MTLRNFYLIRCFVIVAVLFCVSPRARGEEDGFDINIKFSPSARIENYLLSGEIQYQIGTHKGVAYKIGLQGFGKFGRPEDAKWFSKGWEVSCDQDALTDIRSCFIRKEDLVIHLENYKLSITVGGDHTLVPVMYLRIDKGVVHKIVGISGWTGGEAMQLLQEILKSQMVTVGWNHILRGRLTNTFETFALAVAYEFMNWSVSGQKLREQVATNPLKPSPSPFEILAQRRSVPWDAVREVMLNVLVKSQPMATQKKITPRIRVKFSSYLEEQLKKSWDN